MIGLVGGNREIPLYKNADHQWQKLYTLLRGHPRTYARQEEKC